jgi:hypothetical protein
MRVRRPISLSSSQPAEPLVVIAGDVTVCNSFQRGAGFLEARYGGPVDEAYWQANNPANIAIARREALLASGLQIYIEVGDRDMFHLDDHLGRTLPGRLRNGLKFLQTHVFAPPPPDTSYEAGKQMVAGLKRAAGVDDRTPRPPLLGTSL